MHVTSEVREFVSYQKFSFLSLYGIYPNSLPLLELTCATLQHLSRLPCLQGLCCGVSNVNLGDLPCSHHNTVSGEGGK
jgi:hypothetical protein